MRKPSHWIGAAVLALSAGGCLGDFEIDEAGTGDEGGDTDTGETAEALFAKVHPQLTTECITCHGDANAVTGPDYQSRDLAEGYASIMSYVSATGGPIVGNSPTNSKLYFYGAHTGPAMSVELAGLVEDWIIQQAVEDGNSPPPDETGEPPVGTAREPRTLVEALTMFAGCMAYTDYQNTNFQDIANQNTAEGVCSNCHNAGTGGALLTASDIDFYSGTKNMPFILKFVTGTVGENGAFSTVIPSYRFRDKRAENNHPSYILADNRVQSLVLYFDQTYTRMQASIVSGTPCPPDLPPPPQ